MPGTPSISTRTRTIEIRFTVPMADGGFEKEAMNLHVIVGSVPSIHLKPSTFHSSSMPLPPLPNYITIPYSPICPLLNRDICHPPKHTIANTQTSA